MAFILKILLKSVKLRKSTAVLASHSHPTLTLPGDKKLWDLGEICRLRKLNNYEALFTNRGEY